MWWFQGFCRGQTYLEARTGLASRKTVWPWLQQKPSICKKDPCIQDFRSFGQLGTVLKQWMRYVYIWILIFIVSSFAFKCTFVFARFYFLDAIASLESVASYIPLSLINHFLHLPSHSLFSHPLSSSIPLLNSKDRKFANISISKSSWTFPIWKSLKVKYT